MHVVCLGAGRIGSQVACEYALGGHTVALLARRPATARERVDRALEVAVRYGLTSRAASEAARGRLSYGTPPASEMPAALVIEALPEDRGVKRALLMEAAAAWPEATIATTTSSIEVTELGRLAGVPDRIVATHYWNPPLLMPLVEVAGGHATASERVDWIEATLRSLGKRPVVLRADVPGLVWNRLQLALLRECLWLVENRVVSPSQIDQVVRDGLARRWRFLGPFETVSLGGAEVFDAIAANLFPVLSNALEGEFAAHVTRDPDVLDDLARRRDDGLAEDLRTERGMRDSQS